MTTEKRSSRQGKKTLSLHAKQSDKNTAIDSRVNSIGDAKATKKQKIGVGNCSNASTATMREGSRVDSKQNENGVTQAAMNDDQHLRCKKQAVKRGVCKSHGAKVNRKLCNHPGCEKHAKQGGVCKSHGAKVKLCKIILDAKNKLNREAFVLPTEPRSSCAIILDAINKL